MHMLTPETILNGRYRIIQPIGQGGMGTVYEAIDLRLHTTVALKQAIVDPTGGRAFEQEARRDQRLKLQSRHESSASREAFERGELVQPSVAGATKGCMAGRSGGFAA